MANRRSLLDTGSSKLKSIAGTFGEKASAVKERGKQAVQGSSESVRITGGEDMDRGDAAAIASQSSDMPDDGDYRVREVQDGTFEVTPDSDGGSITSALADKLKNRGSNVADSAKEATAEAGQTLREQPREGSTTRRGIRKAREARQREIQRRQENNSPLGQDFFGVSQVQDADPPQTTEGQNEPVDQRGGYNTALFGGPQQPPQQPQQQPQETQQPRQSNMGLFGPPPDGGNTQPEQTELLFGVNSNGENETPQRDPLFGLRF